MSKRQIHVIQPRTRNSIRSVLPGTLCALVAFVALQLPASSAETLSVPVASQAPENQNIQRPRSGMSGKSVVKQYGEPLAVNAPVGEPPISRWEYGNFYVYFEYDRVIHSVLKHRSRSNGHS